ncbi:hypothetical protein DY000_02005772 [Brassica cretica]|uniref:Uncharacterized protein n=1 Tax=Brassica cretica TaxID=69181 RepID=A0ABQ7CFH9_BRACR|nr:hypothetical protein DY000_02005772 [Brassica cretica]
MFCLSNHHLTTTTRPCCVETDFPTMFHLFSPYTSPPTALTMSFLHWPSLVEGTQVQPVSGSELLLAPFQWSRVGVLHVMFKREFPLSVYNLNILLEGLCKNLEYGKTVILLREVRLSSPASDAVSYMTVIRGLCEGK